MPPAIHLDTQSRVNVVAGIVYLAALNDFLNRLAEAIIGAYE
jgi:hypothetical protein